MEPVNLFYSYAHEDESLRDELAGHLKIMERRNVIRSWHDRRIVPGQKWDTEIDTQLESAELVLLLISADFINSDYIWGYELEVALKRHQDGQASVVPVMLRSVDITDAPFAALQGLPSDLRPVTSWPNRDEAWTDVAKGIRNTVGKIQAGSIHVALSTAIPKTSVGDITGRSTGLITKAGSQSLSERGSDPIVDRIITGFSDRITEAAIARGAHDIDSGKAKQNALSLINATNQKRILWVDDRPDNNRFETAALAKLQIEVVAVTSTKGALARLDKDPEPFDLVLSDWQRPELHLDTVSAGIHLLRQLRKRHLTVPVVFYHGSFDERERVLRRQQAVHEGAFGEAVMPDELFSLIAAALGVE